LVAIDLLLHATARCLRLSRAALRLPRRVVNRYAVLSDTSTNAARWNFIARRQPVEDRRKRPGDRVIQ
jgi:hypothetical protein